MDEEEILASLGLDISVLAPVTDKAVITLPPGGNKEHLLKVEKMARELLGEHGLTALGWKFAWDNARQRAGECRYKPKVITLSRPLMSLWTEDQARATILHEIAHALAGSKAGHNYTWQLKAIQIGASPERCWGNDGEQRITGSYVGTCPNGHTITRFRKTAKMDRISCPKCSTHYDPRYKFDWKKV